MVVGLNVEGCCLLLSDSVAPTHVKRRSHRFLSSLLPIGRKTRSTTRRKRRRMRRMKRKREKRVKARRVRKQGREKHEEENEVEERIRHKTENEAM